MGIHIDAALLNQGLSALGSSGILDLTADLGGVGVQTSPEAAPVFVPTQQLGLTSPGDAPLTVLIPNLQVTLDGGERFAVDIAAGVDATVDPATGAVVPTAQAALNINVLECPGGELLCGLVTSTPLLDAFEAFVNSEVIAPLLANSLGQIAVPHVLGLQLGSAHVAQLEGNLSIFLDIAPTPSVSLDIDGIFSNGSQFALEEVVLEVSPALFPGSGPYAVFWTVRDYSGATVYTSPPNGEPSTTITIDADDLNPQPAGPEQFAVVDAEVTVQRGGGSASADGQEAFWWISPGGPCPPQC